jgi:hypothetical protein
LEHGVKLSAAIGHDVKHVDMGQCGVVPSAGLGFCQATDLQEPKSVLVHFRPPLQSLEILQLSRLKLQVQAYIRLNSFCLTRQATTGAIPSLFSFQMKNVNYHLISALHKWLHDRVDISD